MPFLTTSSSNVAVDRGQRRFVSLLFADLCDFTSLNELSDPEDAHALRIRFEHVAARVVARYHGLINQFYGDGLLAVFGFPEPDEEHPRRAIDAALALHEEVRGLAWDGAVPHAFNVLLHSGIHSGLVLAREGDALHGRFDLIGDSVNTAARLCAAAGRDVVLATDTTLRGIEPFFTSEAVSILQLKGKSLPIAARAVVGRSNVATRFEARASDGLTQFVGRALELEQLERATKALLLGRGDVFAIVGAAGLGKTRVLEEFRLRRIGTSIQVCRGYCERYGDIEPLQPFLHMLRQAFGLTSVQPTSQAIEAVQQRLDALELTGGETRSVFLHMLSLQPWAANDPRALAPKAAIVGAVARLFAALGEKAPLVLQLDDWQWADELSQEVLSAVLDRLADSPMLVMLGMRASMGKSDGVEPPAQATMLPLSPFDEPETGRVIEALLPRGRGEVAVDAIHRQSGGNPLFLEELCRSLLEQAASARDSRPEPAAIPTSIRGLIHARVSQLPAAQARLLRLAAVIGDEFSTELLGHIADPRDFTEHLERLVEYDLIHRGQSAGTWRFKHGIAREAIYESVRVDTRRSAHRTIAGLIEHSVSAGRAGDQSEILAYHYAGSGDHAAAAHYAILAGDKATASSSLDRARLQYSAALAAYDALPPSAANRRAWLEVTAKWAFAHMYSPDWSQVHTLERASVYARELNDDAAAARAAHWLGWIFASLGDQANAELQCRRSLQLAERVGDQKLISQLWLNLGHSYTAACKYDEALACLERGLAQKRQHGSGRGVPAGYAYALGCRAVLQADRGETAAAGRDMAEALAAVSGKGHAVEGSLWALFAMIRIWQGDLPGCIVAAQRARAIAQRISGQYVTSMAQAFEGYATFLLERSPRSLQALRSAIDTLESRNIGLFLSFNQACLADALLVAGELAEARDCAVRTLARAGCGDPVGQIMAYRVLARVAHLSGGRAEHGALSYVDKARLLAEQRRSARDLDLLQLLAARLSGSPAPDFALHTAEPMLAAARQPDVTEH
jgi:class 3 adenylate cyclase/tetratricopeptide (TPR) repeat protein